MPAWADAGVICPWTIYLMYGDKRILEQHLPAMKRWVDWCQAHSTNLIRDHDRGGDYGDWLSQGENTPKDLIGTAYFAYSTASGGQSVRRRRRRGRRGEVPAALRANQGRLQPAVRRRRTATSRATRRRLCHGAALRSAARTTCAPKPRSYLEDDIKAHHDHLTTGFVGVSYLLPVALLAEPGSTPPTRSSCRTPFPPGSSR